MAKRDKGIIDLMVAEMRSLIEEYSDSSTNLYQKHNIKKRLKQLDSVRTCGAYAKEYYKKQRLAEVA